MAVLEVRNLEVTIGAAPILRDISFDLESGQTLGVVGESGCGKSMTGFALMGMLPPYGRIAGGSIKLDGRELTTIKPREWLDIRGDHIALVMQDPFTSLNPMMRIGHQIGEALTLHQGMTKRQAWERSIEMLDEVGVPAPESSARKYPHQMSGGQRQRVVLAMAFACKPKVLIADEPTTALDVTLQAQILRLIQELKAKEGTAVMLISHDIGVIGTLASTIAVFYAGTVVERGLAEEILRRPSHPYTRALLNAMPRVGQERLEAIGGQPPDLANLPDGCTFRPRCPFAIEKCFERPTLMPVADGDFSACWRALEVKAGTAEATAV